MTNEPTFAILKYGFLILLWAFVWLAVRSLHRDIEALSPRKSRASRRANRRARKALAAAPQSPPATPEALPLTGEMTATAHNERATLLTLIDGPLAGTSVPLGSDTITLGRSADNTIVLDDEFISSHHARLFPDGASDSWTIEDLGSTNGTVVAQTRIDAPTPLAIRVPVRIGATTFELR